MFYIHPPFVHYITKYTSFKRVQDEEAFQQIFAVCAHVEGNSVFAAQNAFAQLFQVLAVEGQTPRYQRVQDDAEGPHVDFGPVVLFALEELGRGVRRRAAECVELRARRELIRETEICDFDVHFTVEKQVFRLSCFRNYFMCLDVTFRSRWTIRF